MPKPYYVSSMIQVELVPRICDFPRDEWDALLPPGAPPFLKHGFLEALETTGCVGPEQGWTPLHLRFSEGGVLVAAAPAYLKAHSEGEFVFDWGWADLASRLRLRYYPKLVVAVPFTPASGVRLLAPDPSIARRVLPVFADTLRTLVDPEALSSAHVLFPTEEEARILEERGFAIRYGVQYHWHNRGYGSFDDWLSDLPSKRRTQIRRERREIRRQGLVVETLRGSAITDTVLDAVYRFYVDTVKKHVWGRCYLSREFFFEVAQRLPENIEVVLARHGALPVGGALNFVSDGVLHGRYWGSDTHRPYLHFEVCYYHTIELAISRKLRRFEPGAGGEHKKARGFVPVITHSAHWLAHPHLDAIIRRHLAQEREEVREYVSSHRPAQGTSDCYLTRANRT